MTILRARPKSLPIFREHADCTACELGQAPNTEKLIHPGIPTRPWDNAPLKVTKDTAILFVGQGPGKREDTLGRAFMDRTGWHLNQTYIDGSGVAYYADAYIGNATRCMKYTGGAINISSLKACRVHLEEDLWALKARYKRIVVVACGSEAIRAILGDGQSIGKFPQGLTTTIGKVSVVVFGTYLPAILLDGRNPSAITSIEDHLLMVRRYLSTGKVAEKIEVDLGWRGPSAKSDYVSLDIETYGYVEGYPRQTQFHPRKMEEWDNIKRKDIVQTVGISNGGKSKVYIRQFGVDSKVFKRLTLKGQNIPFDILTLWHAIPTTRQWIVPFQTTLVDLSVRNFLDSDQRPERGLKEVAVLFGVDDYKDREVDIKRGERYPSSQDPRFLHYNARDCIVTDKLIELMDDFIAIRYGEDSPKLTEESRQWFSDLLWLGITMSWNGIKYDVDRLRTYHKRLEFVTKAMVEKAERLFRVRLAGKGSGIRKGPPKEGQPESTYDLVERLMDKWTPEEPEAKTKYYEEMSRTDAGIVSVNMQNINLLLGEIPADHEDATLIRLLRQYKRRNKALTSYLRPLLGLAEPDKKHPGKEKEDALVKGFAYPTCYIVPSYRSDSDGEFGGTQQGRITFKGPALQTQPPMVERCQISRFAGGCLIRADQSQIELRVPAAISRDPALIEVYRRGWDLHAKTGARLLGMALPEEGPTKAWGKQFGSKHPKYRFAGKTCNFLRVFRGGPKKMQGTLRIEVGLEYSLDFCEEWLAEDRREYARLYEWQEELLEEAKTLGYLQLPITGISRTFLGDVDRNWVNTVVNFPVQTIAAQITESAQIAIEKWLRKEKLQCLTVSNTYDEGIYDCPATEVDIVKAKLKEVFRMPPFWARLIDTGYVSGEVPLDSDIKVSYNPHN